MTQVNNREDVYERSLKYHVDGKPGKVSLVPTKPLNTKDDLSLAYSPGVAKPCLEIAADPDKVYDYTAKGNCVAVISNGTAVLGLGNIGAQASKPVMEGKAVLFKKFGDVDAVDIEVDTQDVDEFINCVRFLGKTWGGINLEDIKAPECFEIETRLRDLMDIPVFHDDQHGTAVAMAGAMLNALYIAGKKLENVRVVVNGAGAAAIACVNLLKSLGIKDIILCDTKGVIYEGRTVGMNKWKEKHAVRTEFRTLEEAIKGADIFLGLSVAGALTQDMLKSMAKDPIVFAMANPKPEIMPEDAYAARTDVIIATGRSDYPNQVNNAICFPYLFRGALDVRASTINEDMKIAAAHALAELAREDITDEVRKNYGDLQFGRKYIIPVPFDSRLMINVSLAVAKAAVESGVAKKPINDWEAYRQSLTKRAAARI